MKHSSRFITHRFRCILAGWRVLAAGLVLAALSVAAACGGGDGAGETPQAETPSGQTPAAEEQMNAVVVSSDLAVGSNRFSLGLLTSDNELVTDAQLQFRFFKLDGDEATFKFQADPTRIQLTMNFTRTREDGTVETVEVGENSVYVAGAEFGSPGNWVVEASGTWNGEPLEPVTAVFSVQEKSLTPALGDPAPRSVQTILSDVDDIKEIDTSDPPNPAMHDMTIADAIASGKPTLIAFATPAFCVSRICGPTKQVVDELYVEYKGQANFVHVEPYDLEKARSGEGLEVLPFLEDEWGLRSEPWVFLVDKDGKISAKFDAMVSREEIEEALQEALR